MAEIIAAGEITIITGLFIFSIFVILFISMKALSFIYKRVEHNQVLELAFMFGVFLLIVFFTMLVYFTVDGVPETFF